MKDLPHDKNGKKFLKVPRSWMQLSEDSDPHLLGRVVYWACEYAFLDKEPNEADMSGMERAAWLMVKRDVDYQCKHHRGKTFHYISENQEGRFTAEYRLWRDAVFERDEHTCQCCGQVGGKLNAHHILPYATYPELRTSIENGITLCTKCHRAVHRGEIQCPTGY